MTFLKHLERLEAVAQKAAKWAPEKWHKINQYPLNKIVIGGKVRCGRDYIAEINWAKTEGNIPFEELSEHIVTFNPQESQRLLTALRTAYEALGNIVEKDAYFIEQATMDWDGVIDNARQAIASIDKAFEEKEKKEKK